MPRLRVPIRLERQNAQDVIDPTADAFHTFLFPGPDLRRDVVDDSHTGSFGVLGDEPVEAGVVDQDHGVGPLLLDVPLRLPSQFPEFPEQRNDDEDAHHREIRQSEMNLATGGSHRLATESDAADVGTSATQFMDQVRSVLIAARFTDGKENVHERFPSRGPTILGSRARPE